MRTTSWLPRNGLTIAEFDSYLDKHINDPKAQNLEIDSQDYYFVLLCWPWSCTSLLLKVHRWTLLGASWRKQFLVGKTKDIFDSNSRSVGLILGSFPWVGTIGLQVKEGVQQLVTLQNPHVPPQVLWLPWVLSLSLCLYIICLYKYMCIYKCICVYIYILYI